MDEFKSCIDEFVEVQNPVFIVGEKYDLKTIKEEGFRMSEEICNANPEYVFFNSLKSGTFLEAEHYLITTEVDVGSYAVVGEFKKW